MEAKHVKSDWLVIGRAITARGTLKNIQNLSKFKIMKIKICGLNLARDVQLCIDLKVNYLGFVFYKNSPRNIELKNIESSLI